MIFKGDSYHWLTTVKYMHFTQKKKIKSYWSIDQKYKITLPEHSTQKFKQV